jgi:urease accessory protein
VTGWKGHLALHYTRDGERTIAHDRHEGPLRVLQRLYPEGPGICHHVLVHPPGGLAGGDELRIDARLERDTHAVITTPGAARFYRSAGARAAQTATLHLAEGARLEWLPLETIAYTGCLAHNAVRLQLEPGAEMIGWDLLALGLPAADAPFDRGEFHSTIHWPGHWLERARIDATDTLLLDSPLGWAGRRVLATMWFASGSPMDTARRDALLEAARAVPGDGCEFGATSPDAHLVVLRVLAHRVEPAMRVLAAAWDAWRRQAWAIQANAPRVWRT